MRDAFGLVSPHDAEVAFVLDAIRNGRGREAVGRFRWRPTEAEWAALTGYLPPTPPQIIDGLRRPTTVELKHDDGHASWIIGSVGHDLIAVDDGDLSVFPIVDEPSARREVIIDRSAAEHPFPLVHLGDGDVRYPALPAAIAVDVAGSGEVDNAFVVLVVTPSTQARAGTIPGDVRPSDITNIVADGLVYAEGPVIGQVPGRDWVILDWAGGTAVAGLGDVDLGDQLRLVGRLVVTAADLGVDVGQNQ